MSGALPAPRPLTLPTQPQTVTLDLARTALADHRHAERLLRAVAAGSIISAPTTRRIARRSRRCNGCCRRCAAPASMSSGSTGATAPTWPTCRPTRSTSTSRAAPASGLGDPLPGSGAPVLEKDSWAAAIVDELRPEPGRPARRQVPHQRLLGHAARQHPAQSPDPDDALRRRQHRSVRAVHAAGRELPRLRLRDAVRLLRHHLARLTAPRRPSSTSRSASASSPIRRRWSRRSTPKARADETARISVTTANFQRRRAARSHSSPEPVELPYPSRRVPVIGTPDGGDLAAAGGAGGARGPGGGWQRRRRGHRHRGHARRSSSRP